MKVCDFGCLLFAQVSIATKGMKASKIVMSREMQNITWIYMLAWKHQAAFTSD